MTGALRLVTVWIVVAVAVIDFEAAAQPSPDPKARCAQLLAYWDRYGARRGEGGSGPNMTRMGAGIDCEKGRYDSGIKAMEDLLKQNRFTVPPP